MPRSNRILLVPNLPPSEPHFAEPSGPADAELEWFFTMAESSMGLQSNFLDSLQVAEQRRDDTDSRIEAARAHRIILGRLRNMGDPDAGVLHVAYAARGWPRTLYDALGRLTGITVRLGAAEVGLPDDDASLVGLEERVAEALNETLARDGGAPPARSGLASIRNDAQRHFDRAYGAYRRERGRTASLVRRFE